MQHNHSLHKLWNQTDVAFFEYSNIQIFLNIYYISIILGMLVRLYVVKLLQLQNDDINSCLRGWLLGKIKHYTCEFAFQLLTSSFQMTAVIVFKGQMDVCVCVCAESLSHVWFYKPPGSSAHGISQARRLVWVARGCPGKSSRPRDPSPLHLLHWQADSLPLHHLESPYNDSRCNWITIILGRVYHLFVLFLLHSCVEFLSSLKL